MPEKFKVIFQYLLVLLVSYWAVKPLFINGYFPMHDDTQPARIYSMAKELQHGIFPVRMVGDLGYGYGYPLFNFYAPLPYYFGAVIYLAGLDLIVATKIMFALGIILSALFMFKLLKTFGNPWVAYLGTALYSYAPYHAVNIYVRGAVGEYYAYAFLPLFALGLFRVLKGRGNYLLPGILGLAGILLSHNILGLIIVYISALIWLSSVALSFYRKINWPKLRRFTLILVLAFGISAFFLLPAFSEKDFTAVNALNKGNNNFNDHFVYLSQLWDSPWGFGGSTQGLNDGMSFKIGKIHLLYGLISFLLGIYFIKSGKIKKENKLIFMSLWLLFFLSVFLITSASAFIYKYLPYLDFVQYPWRFLNLIVFSLSISVFTLNLLSSKKVSFLITAIMIILVIAVNAKYFNVKYIYNLNESGYLKSGVYPFAESKISDEYLPSDLARPKSSHEIKSLDNDAPGLKTEEKINSTLYKKLRLEVSENFLYQTNIAFFPGWQLTDNGYKLPYFKDNGFIAFRVDKGTHVIEMRFQNTPVRITANAISFLSFILILYLAIVNEKVWFKNPLSK